MTSEDLEASQPTFKVEQVFRPSPEMLDSLKRTLEPIVKQYTREAFEQIIEEKVDECVRKRIPFDIIVSKTKRKHLSIKEIKKIILENTNVGKKFYPSEITQEFGLDLKMVIKAVEELKKERKVKSLKK